MERARPVRKSHTDTSHLLTWSEASSTPPTPSTPLRSRQPSDGIRKVLFGGQVTDEEHQSLMKRKPCSGYKMKEMTGSGIFAANSGGAAAAESSKTSVRMVQRAANGISQISFSAEESFTPKKPISIPEVAKQRELTGTLKNEAETRVKKQVSDAKSKELSGHDIFSGAPENPPRSLATASLLEAKEKKNADQPAPRAGRKVSNVAGGQSKMLLNEETVVKTRRTIHKQKLQELAGTNIFKGESPANGKSASQGKLRELSGSNIFSDGGKVEKRRQYLGGVRKPPGGESSIALI